jgi:hypothetical protein
MRKDNMNIKEILDLDMGGLFKKYFSRKILYTFLIHILEDSKKYYNHEENPKVLKIQNSTIKLLQDLLLEKRTEATNMKLISVRQSCFSIWSTTGRHYANEAIRITHDAINAAHPGSNYNSSMRAALGVSFSTKRDAEHRNYLIEIILKENNINIKTFKLLYSKEHI